ncbi:hypothetical protein BDV24DRAFT_152743 [Aspergillus arachidicola]|uniref:Uncharacterized protein n=1 Tax=Aspergillus arachidicola TaxID=656916 RepID=A0A5N6Y1Q0_9EURO|nr:hypothetical protein BDV24DRAFT_152743 [Aspergillus arachidicola]
MDRGAFRVLVLKRNESRLTAPWSRTRATASYEADGNWGQTHSVSSPLPITRTCDSLSELPLFPRPSLVLGAAADSVDPFCSASDTTSYYYTHSAVPRCVAPYFYVIFPIGNSATTSPSWMVTSRLPTSWVSPMAPRITTTSENEVTHSSRQMAIWLVSSKVATCA